MCKMCVEWDKKNGCDFQHWPLGGSRFQTLVLNFNTFFPL